jgi:hypothetical protein
MTDRNTSMQRDVTAQIVRFNAGRDSERLALKYKALRSCAFSFLRGTCHLFWSQVPPVVVTAMGKILAWDSCAAAVFTQRRVPANSSRSDRMRTGGARR